MTHVRKAEGLVRRGKHWHIDVTVDGKRYRGSANTDDVQQARRERDRIRQELWEQARLGAKEARSWEEAVSRFLSEMEVEDVSERTVADYKRQLGWWGSQYFASRPLTEVTKGRIMEGLYRLAAEKSKATANRYLAPIRSMIYRAAHKWEWIDHAPKKFEQFDESENERKRSLTESEIDRLVAELSDPRRAHQRDMFIFALSTGLRQANVKRLRWHWIDLATRRIRIPPGEFKNRSELVIPLSETALHVIRLQIGKHMEFVFTYAGRPVANVNTRSWRNALKRAGITDYRWHDNRHTWATILRKLGVPLDDIQDLGGWKDPKMVRRYAAADLDALAQKARAIDAVVTTSSFGHSTRVVHLKRGASA